MWKKEGIGACGGDKETFNAKYVPVWNILIKI